MAKSPMQKTKILHILKILTEESNENNRFTSPMLINRLSKLGIKAERKSIYSDIETLMQFGIDIINENGYYIGSRDFELAELKIIIDRINSSQFITEKKTRSLIGKLLKLTDKESAVLLHGQVYKTDFVKTTNENIYYNVDIIQKAIEKRKKVTFKYFSYNVDKSKNYRNDGNRYVVSPYCLINTEDKYYLIGHHPKREGMTHFRVDRMADIQISRRTACSLSELMGDEFSLSSYVKKMFGMYSGETKSIKIQCDNSLINVVLDKFGENVFLYPYDEKTFAFNININVSPNFFAWLFTFAEGMKILSPADVAEEYYEKLYKTMHKYKGNMHINT